jgi:hypothetical protein
MHTRLLPLAFAAFALGTVLAADPAAPPPPAEYDVAVRYRINAFSNERIVQYNEMMRYLGRLGFRRNADEDVPEDEAVDVNASLLRGTVPAGRLPALLTERHVRAVRAMPKGQELPKDKAARVRVDLTLSDGLPPDRQRLFAQQTRQALASLQFLDGVGYDNRGFTRLLGSMPAAQVDALLNDLRQTPAGRKQPAPFQNAWPVRLTRVYPQLPLPAGRPAPPVVPSGQEKLSADLRELLADAARAGAARRLEVILAVAPALPEDRSWVERLSLPGVIVEGRLGPLVTVLVPNAKAALPLAALPEVAAVRLPRVAQSSHRAGEKEAVPLLDRSGVAQLHKMGHRGRGTRLAVVSDDFRGWEAMVKAGQFPEDTRLVDFTRERNRDLQPDPFPPVAGLGDGTRCALTVLRAAPEVQLTLVRIDPAAPYMLQEAARAINGEVYRTVALEQRQDQLREERRLLDLRQQALQEERAEAFRNLGPDEAAVKRRDEYKRHQAEYDRDEKAHQDRVRRYLQLVKDVAGLKGVRVVASGLVWNDGFPADGGSTLSRYFDDRPFKAALWFQAAGDTRGQAWAGLFRDEDGDGVMEFAPPSQPLAPGSWTRQLNFLSWERPGAATQDELPGGARLRISIQWREAHDDTYARIGEDRYREPLAGLRLVVLFQPDPAGKQRPADDLEVVAQSAGLPQRLEYTPRSAVYEQTVELRVQRPGRYALRVEGRAPPGIEPAGVPTIPAARKSGELRARVFVQTLGGAGRALLHDYSTGAGTVGMPADARAVITVGAADGAGKAEPFSAAGPPYGLDLLTKPDVLAFDQGGGTAPAACFAAGLTAAAHSGGAACSAWREALQVRPGGLLRVPPGWPRVK